MEPSIFLVTYKRLDMTEIQAEAIIGNGYRAVDAVAALSDGKKMEPGIIYHFNKMGSSAIILPPEKKKSVTEHMGEAVFGFMNARELFTPSLNEEISDHSEVLSVCECTDRAELTKRGTEPENAVVPEPIPETEWNLRAIKAKRGNASQYSGAGSRIAIIDTGIAYHRDLTVRGGVSFCEGVDNFRNDSFGHGTHCAGILGGRTGGIAKEADLFSIKVSDTTGATPVAILAGLGWALRNQMNVVSISLAGPSNPTYIPAFANAVQALMEINCLVVASAGESKGGVGFPANTPGIIAVGGCDDELVLLDGTHIDGKGNHLTVVAPGKNITTTSHANNDYIGSFTGSSAAAPHVAGLIALIHQKFPEIAPLQVIGRILATTQPTNNRSGELLVPGSTLLIDCDQALKAL